MRLFSQTNILFIFFFRFSFVVSLFVFRVFGLGFFAEHMDSVSEIDLAMEYNTHFSHEHLLAVTRSETIFVARFSYEWHRSTFVIDVTNLLHAIVPHWTKGRW